MDDARDTITASHAAQVVASTLTLTTDPDRVTVRYTDGSDEFILRLANGQAFVFTGKELNDPVDFTD